MTSTATSTKSALDYNESSWSVLAGLRFVLAFIVLAVHLPWFVDSSKIFVELEGFGGRTAVAGFLLVSGVSIGHSLMAQPQGYVRRRFLRIYPLYLVAVCFSIFLIAAVGSGFRTSHGEWLPTHWKTNLANFFFLQGFATIPISYNLPLWTLSIEVSLYALALQLRRLAVYWLFGLAIISMALFFCSHKLWLYGYPMARFAWPWLTGFILATRGKKAMVAILGIMGVAAVSFNVIDAGEHFCWVTYGLSVSIVLMAGKISALPRRVKEILNFAGELSYPLYLFHFPLFLALCRFTSLRNPWVYVIIAVALCIPINYVFDHWLKEVFWKPLINRTRVYQNKICETGIAGYVIPD